MSERTDGMSRRQFLEKVLRYGALAALVGGGAWLARGGADVRGRTCNRPCSDCPLAAACDRAAKPSAGPGAARSTR